MIVRKDNKLARKVVLAMEKDRYNINIRLLICCNLKFDDFNSTLIITVWNHIQRDSTSELYVRSRSSHME